jgi:trehalose 6-phosphate synthase
VASRRRKLIVVSNRGPVSYARNDERERFARRGGGGLVTALSSLAAHHDVTWIASAMTDEDRAVAAESGGGAFDETARDGSPYRLRLLAHDAHAYDLFYNVLANPTLWFLQHYLWNLARTPGPDWPVHVAWDDGYVPVNEAFAEAVLDELDAEPEAAVFFHDYQLYVAPRLVRDRRPEATLAHFVHIPWAQPDYWGVLPERMRVAVHDGLLANDLVGFHTSRWSHNFVLACESIVGADWDEASEELEYGGRRVLVAAHPISVDPAEFDELAGSDVVLERQRRLRETRPELLVVRVDRTDPSKNIVRGFRAFELLLLLHPELHGRVGMLALLDPSRQDISEYSEYLRAIEATAAEVNERFRREGWQPIDLRVEDNFAESVAAYKEYDVLFVNAIFDGMNLVAKEAPLVNERDGVLVLSEGAGAFEELGRWAVRVNPFDVAAQAEALHRALELPADERRVRLEALRAEVRQRDLGAWLDGLLADLDRVASADRSYDRPGLGR